MIWIEAPPGVDAVAKFVTWIALFLIGTGPFCRSNLLIGGMLQLAGSCMELHEVEGGVL